MTTPALLVENLSKAFGGVQAADDVSFHIEPGECVALMGNNGAGKSTVVKMISGLFEPNSGSISIDGEVVALRSPDHARHHGIETVFQDLGLCENLDAASNMFLGREVVSRVGPLRIVRRRPMREATREALADLGVRLPDPAAAVQGYSGGQRQALAMARALRGKASVLLLDEPTAALGLRERKQVEEAVLRVRDSGVAVLLITHNLEEMRAIANRIVVVRQGRSVGELPSTATSQAIVELITGGHLTPTQPSQNADPRDG